MAESGEPKEPTLEERWVDLKSPNQMLNFLQNYGKIHNIRKLQLSSVAFLRSIWNIGAMKNIHNQKAVEMVENFADGNIGIEELNNTIEDHKVTLSPIINAEYSDNPVSAYDFAMQSSTTSVASIGLSVGGEEEAPRRNQEVIFQANLVRDIFGNPFETNPPVINPEWLAWDGGVVKNMADRIYNERDFAALPVLADALQDAGCDDERILSHLRGSGPHVRGCWCLDLILGKE